MPEYDATTQFREIPGFPGYKVGSDGSVWTCHERGGPRQWRLSDRWIQMKPLPTRVGYFRLTLTGSNGRRRSVTVHRLVLESFVGACPEGMQARHLNGVQADNRLENLTWGTVQENHDDKQRHGTTARGERSGKAKLTAEVVRQIRLLAAQGTFLKEIARRFGVTDVNVTAIVRRDTWQHTDHDIPAYTPPPVIGTRHPNSKLTDDEVREIRRLVAAGDTQQVVAEYFGISQVTVSDIVTGRRRKHVT